MPLAVDGVPSHDYSLHLQTSITGIARHRHSLTSPMPPSVTATRNRPPTPLLDHQLPLHPLSFIPIAFHTPFTRSLDVAQEVPGTRMLPFLTRSLVLTFLSSHCPTICPWSLLSHRPNRHTYSLAPSPVTNPRRHQHRRLSFFFLPHFPSSPS